MKSVVEILNVAYKAGVNVMFHGRQGIGKTAVTEGLEKSGEYYVPVMVLSNFDPLVLGGYPGRETIEGKIVSTFAEPMWMSEVWKQHNAGKKIIIFMDEFNRADQYAHNTAMRLINEKAINGYRLPEGTIFAACCNPETEGDAAITTMTDPMINRWCHVPVYSDPKMWLDWAGKEEAGVDPLLYEFVRTEPKRLMGWGEEGYFKDQILKRIKPTPRSNAFVGKILATHRDAEGNLPESLFNNDAFVLMVSGLIGMEALQELKTFSENNYHKPFTVEEMLKPTKKVLEKAKRLNEMGQTQVLIASLETARNEIPAAIKNDITKLTGFYKFVVLAPADCQSDFWHRKENLSFWNQVLVSKEVPGEVQAVLMK